MTTPNAKNLSTKIVTPTAESAKAGEQVIRAATPSPSPRRTKCARITCEHARKLPRRSSRTNTPSAASYRRVEQTLSQRGFSLPCAIFELHVGQPTLVSPTKGPDGQTRTVDMNACTEPSRQKRLDAKSRFRAQQRRFDPFQSEYNNPALAQAPRPPAASPQSAGHSAPHHHLLTDFLRRPVLR